MCSMIDDPGVMIRKKGPFCFSTSIWPSTWENKLESIVKVHRLFHQCTTSATSAGELIYEMWHPTRFAPVQNHSPGRFYNEKACGSEYIVYDANEFMTYIIRNIVLLDIRSDWYGFLRYFEHWIKFYSLSTVSKCCPVYMVFLWMKHCMLPFDRLVNFDARKIKTIIFCSFS